MFRKKSKNYATDLSLKCRYECTHQTANSKQFFIFKQKISRSIRHFAADCFQVKNRDFQTDVSCRPQNIKYALSELQQTLIISIRKTTGFGVDEVFEMLSAEGETVTKSSVYRCLKRNGINKAPETEKEKLKKFKEYEPGFLHVDVTYLPKIDGKKHYLFVAIDRATRTLFYKMYEDKTALSTQDFFDECLAFFPFEITHILTDNGLEFTNKLLKSKTGKPCQKPSLLDERCAENNIDHRLALPATPKTNGMVERANGIIKQATVVKNEYQNEEEMENDLMRFLVFYNLHRRHGSLRKELKVKTPFDAIEKWFKLKPEIFKINPIDFKNKILTSK